jgi:hypothetical protein
LEFDLELEKIFKFEFYAEGFKTLGLSTGNISHIDATVEISFCLFIFHSSKPNRTLLFVLYGSAALLPIMIIEPRDANSSW